jgi:hypothetical protein
VRQFSRDRGKGKVNEAKARRGKVETEVGGLRPRQNVRDKAVRPTSTKNHIKAKSLAFLVS